MPLRAPTGIEAATRNVQVTRPKVDYGIPTAPADRERPEFVRPELLDLRQPMVVMLVGRVLMIVAALLIGAVARRATGGPERAEAFWPVVFSAAVFVVVGVGALVYWTVALAENAQRLKSRATSPRSVGWSWAIPIGWAAASAVTYLQIDVDGDLDPLPGVAGVGLLIALAIPYARLQGVFRGLLRKPPLLWVTAYPLDLLAFGLLWWRLTSWPDPLTRGDWDHTELTSNIAFGAMGILIVNGLVFAWLGERGTHGVFERLGRLEARSRGTDDLRPEWFASGLQRSPAAAPADLRPLRNTRPLTGVVSLFHVLWGVSLVALGIALVRLAFDYTDVWTGENVFLEDEEDVGRVAIAGGAVAVTYVLTIIVHAVWAVLIALNARRVTVHAPNPASFGIIFVPMPVLVLVGLVLGGDVGYVLVLLGFALAFLALLYSNRMLMTLSSRLGGALTGFSRWTLVITAAYMVGLVENFLFRRAVARLGFFATATLVEGVLIVIGGVVGFKAMTALEETLHRHRQTRRAEPT